MDILLAPLTKSLELIFSLTGDWGISIIVFTLLIRLLLSPLSIKSKNSMYKQVDLKEKLEALKVKYKKNENKLMEETQKLYKENGLGLTGCLLPLMQIPIISCVYIAISSMPMEVGTILIPWVESLKMVDSYFIIPIIYTIVSIFPSLIGYIPFLKSVKITQGSNINMIVMTVMSLIITIKAPVSLGLYFISSGIFTFLEELIFRIVISRRVSRSSI